MSLTVCSRVARRGKDKVYPSNSPEIDDGRRLSGKDVVVWAGMPDDIVFFLCFNYQNQDNLSSTCRDWRHIRWLPCLWQSLDLRMYTFDDNTASLLAPRCNNLQKLRFRGEESVTALKIPKAPLREISSDNCCWGATDASLSVIASHRELESLHSPLSHMAKSNQPGLNNYWLSQGVALLLILSQSSQEDVQERAASALGSLVVVDEEFADIDGELCEAVIGGGVIPLLLHRAKSWREGLQLQATMVIATLSVIPEVAKVVAEGGISIL